MKKMFTKSNLLLSLALISTTLLILVVVRENYFDRISKKVEALIIKSKIENSLSSFNNNIMPDFTDYSFGNGDSLLKITVIGNSLTYVMADSNEGVDYACGMAASLPEKDYVHILGEMITKERPNTTVKIRIANFADMERNPLSFNNDKQIDSLINFNTDVLIVQLTENCNIDSLQSFQTRCIELINKFRDSGCKTTFCTTPFFPVLEKSKTMEQVALLTNSYLADLSSLAALDPINYAYKEATHPNIDKWTNPGIGGHPGDYGMANIALRLYLTVNPALNQLQNK